MVNLISSEIIEKRIFLIRGCKVMIDKHLAELYGVKTKALLQAIKRNKDRFPSDFMFQLCKKEAANLRSQFVTSSWGGRRYLPYAFTEQGIAMLSSVLKSKKAIKVNIAIVRAFVRLRQILSNHKELAYKFSELERKVGKHDGEISVIFRAIQRLIAEPAPRKKKIGFLAD
jgi:phage regulator Rha-like protein